MKAKILGALGAMAMALGATPAVAGEFLFDFGNTTGQAGAGNLDGTDGNVRTYTAISGAQNLSVSVTGWSIISGVVKDAWLGAYGGGGLGVTNEAEGSGGSNRHTIDNSSQVDFILLRFNQAVNLDRAFFNSISGGDTDASLGHANVAGGWTTAAINNQAVASLNGLFGPNVQTYGNASDNWRPFNLSGVNGNLWMISALRPGNGTIDSFKLKTAVVKTPPAVPEPQTWLLMISGFGLIGHMMRRQRRSVAAQRSFSMV